MTTHNERMGTTGRYVGSNALRATFLLALGMAACDDAANSPQQNGDGGVADGATGDGGLALQILLPNPADIPVGPGSFSKPVDGTSDAVLHHMRSRSEQLVGLPNAVASLSLESSFSVSADGVTWQDRLSTKPFEGRVMAHRGRLYRYGLPFAIESSADGVQWERESIPAQAFRPLVSLAGELVGVDAAAGLIWRRGVDGTWNAERRPAPTRLINDLASNGSVAIAVGEDGLALRSSSPGYWADISLDSNADFKMVVAWNGAFIGLLSDSRIVRLGEDGLWQKVFEDPKIGLTRILATGAGLFAFGKDADSAQGVGLRTSEGTQWQSLTLAGASGIVSAAHLGDAVFALDQKGVVHKASDGVSWAQARARTRTYNAVNFLSDKFVAVGDGGLLMTSTDGTNWAAATHPFKSDLFDVTFGAGKFVVAGTEGLLESADAGVTWTRAAPALTNIQAIAFGGGKWLAVTPDEKTFISEDFVNWVSKGKLRMNPPTTIGRVGATFWNNRFCAKRHDYYAHCLKNNEWTFEQIYASGMSGQFGFRKMTVNGERLATLGYSYLPPLPPTMTMPMPQMRTIGWPSEVVAAKTIAFTGQTLPTGIFAVWVTNGRSVVRFDDAELTPSTVDVRLSLGQMPSVVTDIAVGAGRVVIVGEGETIASLPVPN